MGPMSDMSARLVAHIGQQVARAEAAETELAARDRRVEAALHVLDTSQTDIAAELERAVREALRGES